ncbi:GNAT family N-acetyltransferase [Streptomyces avicenniae]|uniref:GNAT family N-acetyltransferase n=1 Tax=Streptomyces avicenniae TaxID=500153 RepID=UPI00069A7875|nr:GNAT family protein [Streptomyces avicenniae]
MPVIEGHGVRLRDAGEGDRERFTAVLDAPGVRKWWGDPAEAVDESCAPPEGAWCVAVEHGGLVTGLVQVWEETTPDYRHAALDIAVHEDFHGRGIGGAALYLVARHLFETVGHHRLTIDPAVANEGAVRLYRRLGFRPVGVMREYERRADGFTRDGLLMDMLAGELVAPPPAR